MFSAPKLHAPEQLGESLGARLYERQLGIRK